MSRSSRDERRPPIEPSNTRRGTDRPRLDRLAQTRIGSRLRAIYDEDAKQPLPDRLQDLVERLAAREQERR